MANVREYKNNVFCMLMEEKKYALEVYNSLNHTEYEDPEMVEIVTLEKGISLSVRNDAAYIVDDYLTINEHQSTYSPNLPMRSLFYFSDTIKDKVKDKDLYGRRLVKIPTPRFVVFYNGVEKRPEFEEQRFSESFLKKVDDPSIEVICKVYNINRGNNVELLEHCEVLRNYMTFVDKVRDLMEEYLDISQAVDEAIEFCITEHILEDFFKERKAEVREAMVLDYTFENREKMIKRDAYEDGLLDGQIEGRIEGQIRLMQKLGYWENDIISQLMEEFQLNEEEAKEYISNHG